MVTIENKGRPIDDADVVELEELLRHPLPFSYRKFLLSNNGGIPSPDIVDVTGLPGTPTDVQVFFGIGDEVESCNLHWNLRTFSELLPGEDLLPIACDSGGNLFCIMFSEDCLGNIFYYDFEVHPPVPHPVAQDFSSFLQALKPFHKP